MRGRSVAIIGLLFLSVGLFAAPSAALAQQQAPNSEEARKADLERLLQCDRDLCAIVTDPSAAGEPLRCRLAVLWKKHEIAAAIDNGRIKWPFGDASCSGKLDISRQLLTPALKEPAHKMTVPPQPVACEIDNDGSRHQVTANMAPVLEFKAGKATSVNLGLQDIKGNAVISNAVWAAWKIESYFGYFQEALVKGVNGYIENWCPNREVLLKDTPLPK